MAVTMKTKPADVILDEQSKLQQKQGKAAFSIKQADGTETTAEQLVGKPKVFNTPPCVINVESGMTIGLPSYSSARVGVSLSIPCAHGEINEIYDFAKKWVDEKMDLMIAQVNAAKASAG